MNPFNNIQSTDVTSTSKESGFNGLSNNNHYWFNNSYGLSGLDARMGGSFNPLDSLKQWEEPRGVDFSTNSKEMQTEVETEILPPQEVPDNGSRNIIVHQTLEMANTMTCGECDGIFTENNNPMVFSHCDHMACSLCYNCFGGLCSQCLGFDLNGSSAPNQFDKNPYFDLPQAPSTTTWSKTLDNVAPAANSTSTEVSSSTEITRTTSGFDLFKWVLPKDPAGHRDSVKKLFSHLLKNDTTENSSGVDDGSNLPTSDRNEQQIVHQPTNSNSTFVSPVPDPALPPPEPQPLTMDNSKSNDGEDESSNPNSSAEELGLKPKCISQGKDKVTYVVGQQVEFVVEKEESIVPRNPRKQFFKYNTIADSFTRTEDTTSEKAQIQSNNLIKCMKIQRQIGKNHTPVILGIPKIMYKNQGVASSKSKLKSESNIPTVIISSSNGSKQTLNNLRLMGGFRPTVNVNQPMLNGLTTTTGSSPSHQGVLAPVGQFIPKDRTPAVVYLPNIAQLCNVTPKIWKNFYQIQQSSPVTTTSPSSSTTQ